MASIKELPNGKARVSWYDSKGVRHRPVLPKKEAQELYKQVLAESLIEKTGLKVALKRDQTASRLKFSDLATRYMEEHLLTETRAGSNSYYVKILIKKWGDYKLKMMDTAPFRKWIRFALANPIQVPDKDKWKLFQLSASSVDKLVRYATAIFNWAMEEGIIDYNPLIKVKDRGLKKEFRRRKNFKPVILTSEEFWEMISDWPSYVRDPAICCFFSGIRRSELSVIRWSRVNRSAHRFEFEADIVKEADSKYVYYDVELEEVLERLQIKYLTHGYSDDVVFRGKYGGAITTDSFTHSVRDWADKAAVRTGNQKYFKVTPHTLRRSYRTRKDMEGADRKAVAANMGHHSLDTSEIYNLVDEDRLRSVAGIRSGNPEEVRSLVDKLVETGMEKGLTLTEIQTEIRRAFSELQIDPKRKMPRS